MNMQALMQQAHKMQKDIMKKKEAINSQEFVGKSGLVTVTMNGKRETLSVKIDSSVSLEKDDIEALQDMIAVAYNDVLLQIDNATNEAMNQYGGVLDGLL